MGYSIAIHCQSAKKLEQMKDFMEKNFTPLSKLVSKSEIKFYYANGSGLENPPTINLGYDHHKLALGFHYNFCEAEDNYYRWKVLAWMAIKVGKKYKFKDICLPAVWYDGAEKCPLHFKESDFELTPGKNLKYVVDKTGWSPLPVPSYYERIPEKESKKDQEFRESKIAMCNEISKLVKDELLRLDALWID